MDHEALKLIGIELKDTLALQQAYEQLRALPVLTLSNNAVLMLDLNALPQEPFNFKEVFLRWALQANEANIQRGREPIFPYELIKQCPLWKLVAAPWVSVKLTKEGLLNRPSANAERTGIGGSIGGAIRSGSVGRKLGSINRRK